MILEDQIKAKMVYIDISDYLYDTEMDLYRCTWEKDKLCELDHLWSQIQPDYSNYTLQHFYSLKYTYAYAFENKEMYRILLNDYFGGNHRISLKIESLGCGNMVDGWSLFSVLIENWREYSRVLDQIDYKGIDIIEWSNPLITREHFINIDAAKWFERKNDLEANVYMFPRSIGDFSDIEYDRMLKVFRTKDISAEVFYLMASGKKLCNSGRDRDRVIELCHTIENRGYKRKCIDSLKDYGKKSITSFDRSFVYPEVLRVFLSELKHSCRGFSETKYMCRQCNIDNNPMLYADNVSFLIMKFEREQL